MLVGADDNIRLLFDAVSMSVPTLAFRDDIGGARVRG